MEFERLHFYNVRINFGIRYCRINQNVIAKQVKHIYDEFNN